MNKNIILTDCDGVLLDWETTFVEWMGTKGFTPDPGEFGYEMAKRFGMKKQKVKDLIREFNESAWIGYLKPYKDAVWGVEQLAAKGWRFGAITSLSEDEYAGKLRAYNLEQLFGDVFEFVECIGTGADKDDALLPYLDTGCMWVEDKPENAELGANMGLNSILMTHPFSKDYSHEDVTRVDNWKEIYELLV